jgi:hypothetical protein
MRRNLSLHRCSNEPKSEPTAGLARAALYNRFSEAFVEHEEAAMPTYILLSTLTPEGLQTLHKNPDRLEEVNKEIAAFDCTVVGQYAVLGFYPTNPFCKNCRTEFRNPKLSALLRAIYWNKVCVRS